MIGLALGWGAGVIVGVVVTFGLLRGRALASACPDPEAHELSNANRESAAREVDAHARRLHASLSAYADLLAGDDTELRLRLQRFEGDFR